MSILRLYEPGECDERGVPLDWERCRTCGGCGRKLNPLFSPETIPCPTCGGHGSLKAAALAALLDRQKWAEVERRGEYPMEASEISALRDEVEATLVMRCEDCGHPMGDGTWERGDSHPPDPETALRLALGALGRGKNPPTAHGVFWSPCDEGCRHGAPYRNSADGKHWWYGGQCPNVSMLIGRNVKRLIEASWRSVDVRTLGWPHDLRPEKLVVLCLRCLADRGQVHV